MEIYSGIIALIIYVIGLLVYLRYEATHDDEEDKQEVETRNTCITPLDINDEDATVASLIAAIECRNEFKKNVRVVSVRRVN